MTRLLLPWFLLAVSVQTVSIPGRPVQQVPLPSLWTRSAALRFYAQFPAALPELYADLVVQSQREPNRNVTEPVQTVSIH